MMQTYSIRAIKFCCAYCDHTQFTDDTLELNIVLDETVRADVIRCQKCGKDNKVIMKLKSRT